MNSSQDSREQTADGSRLCRTMFDGCFSATICPLLPSVVYRLSSLLCCFVVLAISVFSPTADAQSASSFSLECSFRGGEGIFAPQQSLILDVMLRPTSPNVTASTPLTLNAQLTKLSLSEPHPVAGFTTHITPNVPLPLSFVTPDKEGVYEITLTTVCEGRANILLVPIARQFGQNTVEVRRQFVVLRSQGSPRRSGDWTLVDRRDLAPGEYRQNEEGLSARRLLSNLPHLPHFPKVAELSRITDFPRPAELIGRIQRPFNRHNSPNSPITDDEWMYRPIFLFLPNSEQGHFSEKSALQPEFSSLSPAGIGGCTWSALSLDTEVGKPYLIEIDYPVGVPQTFGIGIVTNLSPSEKQGGWGGFVNAATTIHVSEEIVQDSHVETVATHRLFFWAPPLHHELVLINRQPHQEALFRNIRISQVVMPGQQDNLRLPKLFEGTAQRKRIGQILETIFVPFANQCGLMGVYEITSRLLDTLSRGGYDGVVLTVLSKHSSPSVDLEANSSLELMFRQFSNEGLTLIPAVEFDMPIPSLELLIQQHPGITDEIVIGNLSNTENRRYNLLHPAVQQAMMETVLALVDRFGQHPSFGGVAVVLSPKTYAQLPFARHSPDDHTFMQFRQDTEKELGIPFPDEQHLRQTLPLQQFLVQKNAVRLQFLESKPVWETWVRWQATKVSRFYADLAKQITEKRGDAPLYLLGGKMFDQQEIQQFCVPTLPRNFAPLQAIQLLGFDLPFLSQTESLHFLKPVIVSETSNHSYDGLDSVDTDPLFSKSGMLSGVQFIHADTDYFVTTPAHFQSRKRFVRQLAQADVLMFMDAGMTLPFGQESAQFGLLDTYRRLPPVPFQTFQSSTTLQPLTVRTHNAPDGMIVYIVNDAPFAVEADFFFSADSKSTLTELTEHRMIRSLNRSLHLAGAPTANLTWRASLLPYDLLAVRISDANANIESVTVHRPQPVEETLKQKVEELRQRVQVVRDGVPLGKLVNADFELPPDATGGIPGWLSFGNSLTALLDHTVAGTGQNSVRLENGAAEAGTFVSQPFDIPITGRLDVSMFIGVPADCQSLPMNVVLSAKYQGKPFHRSSPVGETLMPQFANVEPKNGTRWLRWSVPFRLPLEPLEEVRVGVMYSGIGTVWIDNITLNPVPFSANEIVELHRMSVVADERRSTGRVSELMTLLEGHWAQFLFEHVPVQMPQPAVSVARPPIAVEVAEPPKSPTIYQQVRGWFVR